MSRELVWVCDVCGHREPVIEPSEEPEDRYYPGDAEVCLYCDSGIATVVEERASERTR